MTSPTERAFGISWRLLLAAVLALALARCAPLNTATMSRACRDDYNACLSGCQGRYPPTSDGLQQASCTSACNERAKGCR